MAATHYSPLPIAPGIEDPVTYREASALLARTGHPAARGTIARWVAEANAEKETIPVVRVRGTDYVSWSAILEEHGRRTAVKLRASAAW